MLISSFDRKEAIVQIPYSFATLCPIDQFLNLFQTLKGRFSELMIKLDIF